MGRCAADAGGKNGTKIRASLPGYNNSFITALVVKRVANIRRMRDGREIMILQMIGWLLIAYSHVSAGFILSAIEMQDSVHHLCLKASKE